MDFDRRIVNLDRRIINLDRRINDFDRRIVNVDRRINDFDRRIVNVDRRINDFDRRIVNVDRRINDFDRRIVNVGIKIVSLDRRIVGVERRITNLDRGMAGDAHGCAGLAIAICKPDENEVYIEKNLNLPLHENLPCCPTILARISSMLKEGNDLEVQNEDMLIKGCIEWDRNAQNRLYKLFCARMMGVCFRYSKSREEAEDTLQEGFMKVFENIKFFKKEGSLEGWIRRIMINTAIEKFRKTGKFFTESIEHHERLDHYSAEDTISNLGAKELIHLVQKLPPKCQMVFNLYVFEGLKHKEIAEQLGITEGTSKSNLSDARAMLQRSVNKLMMAEKAMR